MKKEIYLIYKYYCKEYKLSDFKTKKLWNIIRPICYHKEFLTRFKPPYWHHDNKTLAEHIICDAIVTYKIITKPKLKKHKDIDINTTILIAMFHDLYEEPWQNNIKFKYKKLVNKHGFIHPIEAITNAITWFPQYFKDEQITFKIIDGILHHMYPLPVRALDNTKMELNNQQKFDKLSDKYKKMIEISTKIGKVGSLSFRKSIYLEGRILSKADKIVALGKDIKSINGLVALISGKNKKLLKKLK